MILNNYLANFSHNLVRANFNNCIITGSEDDELKIDSASNGSMNYRFDHCIIKTKDTPTNTLGHFFAILKNDPDFVDKDNNNYELNSQLNAGDFSYVFGNTITDIKGTTRLNPPDLGAYEKIP